MVKFRVNFGIFVNISRSSVSYSSNGISRILKKASLSIFVILTFAAKMSLLNDIAGTVPRPQSANVPGFEPLRLQIILKV